MRSPLSPEEKKERARLLYEARKDKLLEKKNIKAALKRRAEFLKDEEKRVVHIANDDPGFKVWKTVGLNI